MKRPVLWLILILVVAGGGVAAWFFLTGQGMNLAQLREKYGSRYEEMRQQLKKVAAALPPKGSVKGNTTAKDLDPKPVYDVKQESYNVEIVMADKLLDPDVDLNAKKEVDLQLTDGRLVENMRILGPKSARGADVRQSGKSLESYERALNLPYLVVLRPTLYVKPLSSGEKNFTPGMVQLEGFLFDLRKDKLLASFRAKGETSQQVQVQVRSDESREAAVEGWAYSALWADARKDVEAKLREITGGTFEFKQ